MKIDASKWQKSCWHYSVDAAVIRSEAFLIRGGERERENNKNKSASVAERYMSTTLQYIMKATGFLFVSIFCVRIA